MKNQKADNTYQSFADFVREQFPKYTDESIDKLFSYCEDNWKEIDYNGTPNIKSVKDFLKIYHVANLYDYIKDKKSELDSFIDSFLYGDDIYCIYDEYGNINRDKLMEMLKKFKYKEHPNHESLNELDENGDDTGEERFAETDNYNIKTPESVSDNQTIEQLKINIKNLKPEEKERLKAVILLSTYELYVQAAKSPADMRKELGNYINEKKKKTDCRKIDEKAKILMEYPAFQFWDSLLRYSRDKLQLFKEISYNGNKQLIKLYNKYKKSFGRRPSKQIENLCKALKKDITDNAFKDKIINAFKFIRFHKNLNAKNIPIQFKHDIEIHKAALMPCDNKKRFILLGIVLKEKLNKTLTDEESDILMHSDNCQKCKTTLEAYKDAIFHRMGQLGNVQENSRYYKPHKSYKMKSRRAGSQDPLKYYTREFKKYPTELNALYMTLAKKLSGKEITAKKITTKENKTTSAEGKTSDENLDYILSVRCICGGEDRYNLNHLSHKEVFFGRKDDSDKKLVHIDVCTDDNYHISRCQCSFIYEGNCWKLYAGNNYNDKNKAKKASKMFYIGTSQMKGWLKQVIKAKPNKKQYGKYCQALWKNADRLDEQSGIPLKEIACIGIFPLDGKLKLDNKTHEGIKHPLFGIMPYCWFIEVMHPRTEQEVLASYIEHSYIEGSTVTEQQKTILSEE